MKTTVQRNIFFSFLAWLLPLGLTFVSTPIIVRGLGTTEFGLYALALSFISYSFTFNLGRAVTKYVAEYRAEGKHALVGEVLSATLFLNLIVGAGGAGVLILFARVFVVDVLQIEAGLQAQTIFAFYLAAATIAVWMSGQVFSAVLQAVGRFDWFSHIALANGVLLVAGNLLLIWNGFGLLSLLWWNLLSNTVNSAILFFAARHVLPDARIGLIWRGKILRLIVRYSAGVVLYQTLANVWLLFERSYLTGWLGAQSLTYYAVPMTLATYIHIFVISLSLALLPLTSEAGAAEQRERLREIYQRATKYIAVIVVLLAVMLSVGSRMILALWLGSDFAQESGLILIFHTATFSLLAVGVVAWQICDGLGFPMRNAALIFAMAIIGALSLPWAVADFGISGAAAVRAAATALTVPIFILWIEKKTFGKSLWQFWGSALPRLILAGTVAGATVYFLLANLPVGWLSFFLTAVVGGLIYAMVLLGARFFSSEERRWLRQFARKAAAAS